MYITSGFDKELELGFQRGKRGGMADRVLNSLRASVKSWMVQFKDDL
jgi:hypothetical protein